MKILFIGADIQTVETVAEYLAQRWPDTKTAHKATVTESLEIIEETSPDAALFYANFPDIEASAAAISQLRRVSDIPLLVLSPQRGEQEVVTALHFGADDYVTKPFSPKELVARVKAVLRRSLMPRTYEGETLHFDELSINPRTRVVIAGGRNVELTAKEFDLLLFMARNQRQVFSREQLLNDVWDYVYAGDTSTVTVHIRRLREKIEADPARPRYILTVWGVGYKFGG